MKDFITSLPGRIVIISALLIIVGGIIFFSVLGTRVNSRTKESVQEETEQDASVSSSSKEEKRQVPAETDSAEDEESYIDESLEQYLKRTAKIENIISVNDSQTVMTGAEAIKFLSDRGFDGQPIECDFAMDGEYVEGVEVTSESSEKYPEYTTYFEAENGCVWIITVSNGSITAVPISYIIDFDVNLRIVLSESDKMICYDPESNQFFEVIPDKWEYFLVTVPKIDAETLNKMTNEELDKLWK
ncbi:MAG: hypothetical protein IK081_13260 [Lachnospiraceae bacterium]|nr:hypothetical protein [Lachnospiraceae bacterium]